jgi:chromosome segregation ATPase
MSTHKQFMDMQENGQTIEDMQHALLNNVKPNDLMAAIQLAAQKQQENSSRPVSSSSSSSTSSENDELVKRLEVQGKRKKELGMLIGQLHSLMDDEPVEKLKEKLKEIDELKLENDELKKSNNEYEDKILNIEADAAQQVQSVLDTNEKLQKELVKLSRDLSTVESTLSEQKQECKEKVSTAETHVKQLAEALEDAQGKVDRNNDVLNRFATQLQDEQKTKHQIVEKLKIKSIQLEESIDQIETLKAEKVNVSTHLWNLTEKLKSISSALEASQAESSATKLDRERLEEELLECQNKFADKSKLCDQYFTAMEENEKKLNETSLMLNNVTAKYVATTKEASEVKKSYEQQNQILTKSSTKLKEKLDEACKKLKHFEGKSSCIPAMQKKMVEQTSIISNLQTENKGISKDLNETRNFIKQIKDENSKLDKMLSVLQAEKQATESHASAVEAECSASERKFTELAESHEKLLNDHNALENQFAKTRKQFDETKENFQLIVQECKNLKEKLNCNKEQFENSRQTLNEKINLLEDELAVTQGERDGYHEEIEIMSQAVEESEKQLSDCRAQIAQFTNDTTKNTKQMESDAELIKQLEEDKTRMRDMIVKVENEKREMLLELKDREKEFNIVQREVSELQDKLEQRIAEKTQNEQYLNEDIKHLTEQVEEQKQFSDKLSREALQYQSSIRDFEIDLREVRSELKKVTKESVEQTINQNERYKVLESSYNNKEEETNKLMDELARVKRESMVMNEKYENSSIELQQITDTKILLEKQMTTEIDHLKVELKKATTQLDRVLASASSLEECNQVLQVDIDNLEKDKLGIQAQLTAETEARKRLASEIDRERGKYQRLSQQSNLEIDNVRQDLASMRRRAEDGERIIIDLRKKNDQTYEEFDKSKAEMRKQIDEILSSQAKEQASFHEDNQEVLKSLEKSQEDLKNEENHTAELRRTIEGLKVEVETKDLIIHKAQRRESEMKEEIAGIENQMVRVRQDRTNDVKRLEEKLALTRKEKINGSKDAEKLKLKLRASSREIDELRRQINILKSEEDWRKKEINRLQQGAKDEIYSKEQQMSEALRQEEQKRKETERQAFQNHTSTIQEIEQLRRRNKDLSESVQSLTHALQTLTGSGEKRGHSSKKSIPKSKRQNLKRPREEEDGIISYHVKNKSEPEGSFTPLGDVKTSNSKSGRNSRPSSSSSNKGGSKAGSKKKKKSGKDTARRNSITEALRRRGWRPSDTEDENAHPSNYNINSDSLNGSKSPVMSNTSASKIRKLARQDSRTSIGGDNVQNKRYHTKRGVSASSLPLVQGEMQARPNSRGPMSR